MSPKGGVMSTGFEAVICPKCSISNVVTSNNTHIQRFRTSPEHEPRIAEFHPELEHLSVECGSCRNQIRLWVRESELQTARELEIGTCTYLKVHSWVLEEYRRMVQNGHLTDRVASGVRELQEELDRITSFEQLPDLINQGRPKAA